MNLRSLKEVLGLISTLVLFLGASGCSTPVRLPSEVRHSTDQHLQQANQYRSKHQVELDAPGHRSHALHALELAQHLIDSGEYPSSKEWFEKALQSIGQLQTEHSFGAAVQLAEGAKFYKGEAYDRASARFYLGYQALMNKQYETALKHFRLSLQEDASTVTTVEAHKRDFSIAWYFVAVCYQSLDQNDNARIAYRNSELPSTFLGSQYNTYFVITSGRGPIKRKITPELLSWELANSPYDNVSINIPTLSKTALGVPAINISQQASQDIDAMKAARDLTGSLPDTRYWSNIPDFFYVVPLYLDSAPEILKLEIVAMNKGRIKTTYTASQSMKGFDSSEINAYYFRISD